MHGGDELACAGVEQKQDERNITLGVMDGN